MRGIAAAFAAYIKSPGHHCGEICKSSNLHEKLREIVASLDRIHFSDIEPPDEEALEHALEHDGTNGAGSAQIKLDSGARRESLAELGRLRNELKQLSGAFGLSLPIDDPPLR